MTIFAGIPEGYACKYTNAVRNNVKKGKGSVRQKILHQLNKNT